MSRLPTLKKSLAVNIVALIATSLLSVSVFVLVYMYSSTYNTITENNIVLSKAVSAQVESYLLVPMAIVENIAEVVETGGEIEAHLPDIIHAVAADSELFESLYVLDANGAITSVGLSDRSIGGDSIYIGLDMSHMEFFKVASQTRQPAWSDTFFSLVSGQLALALCVPAGDIFVVGNFNLKQLSEYLVRIAPGSGIDIAIADGKGAVVAHSDKQQLDARMNIGTSMPFKKALEGDGVSATYVYNGIEYLGTAQKIGPLDWVVMVSQTAKRAYKPIWRTGFILALCLVAALLFAVAYSILKAKRLAEPFVDFAETAKTVQEGKYDIEVVGQPYEEVEQLATSFTHMVETVRQREADLQESENKYRTLAESTHAIPWELDIASKKFTYIAPRIETVLGYPVSYWKSLDDWAKAIHPDDRDAAVWFCEVETEKGADHEFQYKAIASDGSIRWIHDIVSVQFADEKPQKLIGYMLDITETKQAELEKMELEEKLGHSQRLEALGTLAGGIAHDFNNLLMIILGYSELALASAGDNKDLKGSLNSIATAANRAKEIVGQILSFGRKVEAEPELVDLGAVAEESITLLRATIPTTIKISASLDGEVGKVYASPSQLSQVVMNLASNASQAMKGGQGVLGLEVGKKSLMKGGVEKHFVCLKVSDTGSGMDEETRSRVFEPYFTTKAVGEGSGMGLSVVHGIIMSLGGTIEVNSEIGKGTEFIVCLPEYSETSTSEGAAVVEEAWCGYGNILVVDDEEPIAKLIAGILEDVGCSVDTCCNSQEALDRINQAPDRYDLLVTDQTMPRHSGKQLLELLHKDHPTFPVVLCTGYSEELSGLTAHQIGAAAILQKPVDRGELLDAVKRALES